MNDNYIKKIKDLYKTSPVNNRYKKIYNISINKLKKKVLSDYWYNASKSDRRYVNRLY